MNRSLGITHRERGFKKKEKNSLFTISSNLWGKSCGVAEVIACARTMKRTTSAKLPRSFLVHTYIYIYTNGNNSHFTWLTAGGRNDLYFTAS